MSRTTSRLQFDTAKETFIPKAESLFGMPKFYCNFFITSVSFLESIMSGEVVLISSKLKASDITYGYQFIALAVRERNTQTGISSC